MMNILPFELILLTKVLTIPKWTVTTMMWLTATIVLGKSDGRLTDGLRSSSSHPSVDYCGSEKSTVKGGARKKIMSGGGS